MFDYFPYKAQRSKGPGPKVIEFFSCSTQLCIKYQEIQHFSGSDKPRMLFFLLVNVKMPNFVGILTFMSRKNFMLS